MLITKRSAFTGKLNSMDIPSLTEEMLQNWEKGMLIQNAMPDLTADEREFIMTGVTSEEWDAAFGEDGEEEYGEEDDEAAFQ